MTYLNLIPAVIVIAAYCLERYIGKRSRDEEITQLTLARDKYATLLDFAQAENEHVAGMLKQKVAMAHKIEEFESLGSIEYVIPIGDYDGPLPQVWTPVDRSPGVKCWDRSVKCVACERTIDLQSERPQDVFAVKCQCGHLTDKPA